MKVRLVLTLLWYRPPFFSYVNDVVVMLICKNSHNKSSEVSSKTRSTPASLSFIGQVTKHSPVKCTICPLGNQFCFLVAHGFFSVAHPLKTEACKIVNFVGPRKRI